MESAESLAHPGAQEALGVRLGDSCDHLSPTLGMRAGGNATNGRESALAEAPVFNDGCGGVEPGKQRDARETDRTGGTVTSSAELRAENAGGGCTIPGTEVPYALVSRRHPYPNTLLPAAQMLLRSEANARGEQPALEVEKAELLMQKGRLSLLGSGEYGEQSNTTVSGTGGQAGVPERECNVATNSLHARTDNAGSNSGQSRRSAARVSELSPETFRRKAYDIISSISLALQRCGTATRNSYLTDRCSGRDLDGNTSGASACSTTARVERAARFLRSLCTGDPPTRNAAACASKAAILLLLEQINANAGAAPAASRFPNSLGSTLPHVNGVHSTTGHEGASVQSPQASTERILERRRETPGASANHPIHGGEIQTIQTSGIGRGTLVVGIQTLPPGKQLGDYYLIGPILDVCMQPQQVHNPDSGRRLPNKRLHSPQQTNQREAHREIVTSRKVCRRESLQRNPREVTTITCSNAGRTCNAEQAVLLDMIRSRDKEIAHAIERRLNRARADVLVSSGTGTENSMSTRTGKASGRGGGINRPLQTCGRHVNANTDVREEMPLVNAELSVQRNQIQNIGYNGGRPVLRFAVARSSLVGTTERSPVKIIKSIEKRRVPTSAGGDRLWRQLCERLLSLPPHPNVLSVEAIFEDSTFFHFVLERLEGGELFAFLLREKMVDEPVCQYIVYQILLALHHLHSHNLLHRDVKPENLVFRRRRQKTVEPSLPENCAPGCLRSSLASSSSSTVVPSSASKRSSSASPTHLYSDMAGDHSPTNTGNFSSTSSSSSSSCTVGPSDMNSSPCSRGYSASPNAAQTGFSHFLNAAPPAQTAGVPLSPSNSSSGSRRRKVATDTQDLADILLPQRVGAGEETAEGQPGQTCGVRRARKTTLDTIKDYELVLIDFDTCKMIDVPSEEYGEVVGGRRRLVGTYGYLAPEVLCGHVYSAQSDLWSVGIILYILLTGTPPLPMEDMVSACSSLNVFLEMHEEHGGIQFDIPPFSDSPLARDLCQRLLRLSRKDRLNSAWEALSHPWFDNLSRGCPREDLRGMRPLIPSVIPPTADQRASSCNPRERTGFGGSCRCQARQSPTASPLNVPPLDEPHNSPLSYAPEHTPLAFNNSPASAGTRPFAVADSSVRGCVHLFLPRSGEQAQQDAQRSTATSRRE